MVSSTMYQLGAKRSCIRELFEFGLQQAKKVGKDNVMDFSIGNPSIPTPDAVTTAFDDLVRSEDIRPCLEAYDLNRMTLYNALISYGYQCAKPEGAFYLFPKAPGGNAKAFSDRAKAENLLVVPGDDFGCPEFFRISTCVSYDMVSKSLPVFQKLITNT